MTFALSTTSVGARSVHHARRLADHKGFPADAFPQFNQKYGEQLPNSEKWEVPAPWQAGLSNGAMVGELIGLLINGWVSERFGYRWTVIASLMVLNGWIALFFTAQNVQTLLAAEILCGVVRLPRIAGGARDADSLMMWS